MAIHSLRLCLGVPQSRVSLSQAKIRWRQSVFVQTFATQLSTQVKAPLLLKSSQFAYLFEEGPTETIYRGTPLHGLGQHQQGQLAQEWARSVLLEQNPDSEFLDPEPGTDCNGHTRSLCRAPYDFLMNGRRVEVKSSRLVWDSIMQCWLVRFRRIKQFEFDQLFLVLVCPDGMCLIQHDLTTGLCTDGKRTETSGHFVQVRGSRRASCWEEAIEAILFKLRETGTCSLLVRDYFGEGSLVDMLLSRENSKTRAENAYSGTALRNMSSGKRGKRLEAMGLAVDRILHPKSRFSLVRHDATAATRQRNAANAEADWSRDGRRVELKSSSLVWDSAFGGWKCVFAFIKPDFFDELWLAIYSPLGVHFYRSDLPAALNFETCGTATEYYGLRVQFRCRHEADPLKALQEIEAKIVSKGCQMVATVQWEQGCNLGG